MSKSFTNLNELTGEIIAAAIEVHKHIGPGCLEHAYQVCLEHELELRGIPFVAQRKLPVVYKSKKVRAGYRIDIFVAGQGGIEIKATEGTPLVHEAQLLTYLRLTECPVGLLINFNVPVLKQGIRRKVNNFLG